MAKVKTAMPVPIMQSTRIRSKIGAGHRTTSQTTPENSYTSANSGADLLGTAWKVKEENEDGSLKRQFVAKFGYTPEETTSIETEQRLAKKLYGALHFAQPIVQNGKMLTLDSVPARDSKERRIILMTEFIPNLTLGQFYIKVNSTPGSTWSPIPNRVLWLIFRCLVRAVLAMAAPPDRPYWDANEAPTLEVSTRQPARDDYQIYHGGLGNIENMIFGDLDRGEHRLVPILKVIDLGMATDHYEYMRSRRTGTMTEENVKDIGDLWRVDSSVIPSHHTCAGQLLRFFCTAPATAKSDQYTAAMASKRKADDFIYTLSDNDEIPGEELPEQPNPPKKKSKKSKKTTKTAPLDEDDEELGVWGKKEDDDGAMASDFEFAEDATTDFRTEDFEGWGFDRAKGMNGTSQNKRVDIEEIVRRRRDKKGKTAKPDAEAAAPQEDGEIDVGLDDEDDEVLAADGFGMGAASDEESGDEAAADGPEQSDEESEDDEAEGDGDASDNDSVATALDHPGDVEQSDATDDEEDVEEAAKRKAFFAPEEKQPKGKQEGKAAFQGMSLSRPILRGLNSVGFNTPTPIQAKCIPLALEGKDLVGGAVTGSGKTAAFVVPILERLLYRPNKIPTSRVVILAPTRELAIQCHSVATKLASHTDIKFCLAVGGLSLKIQEAELRLRPDVVIATPGRFIDHMRNSASFSIDTIEILVLDEADRMLEDGFADELNEILTTMPKSRQTMLFSATMTSSVDRLIRAGLNKPVRVMVDSQRKTVDKLEQKFVRLRPGREDKRMGYLLHICKTMYSERVIIFFRQKKEAHRARLIFALFNLSCAELHGSMNQTQRIESVEAFRDGKVSFLLATDLASRGLDIKGVDTVINYEGPQNLEIYVHRVGRTARAGRSGVAVTLAAEPDRKVVKAAVKAGKAQGAKISSLIIETAEADKWQNQIDEMGDEIEAIAHEEKEEKQLAQAEMQIKKGENMVVHEDEIKSRPKRTWFETQHDKQKAKDAGRAELNGLIESLKKKGNGKLSNKDKKKLDARSTQKDGTWKKGSAERAGKGAVLNLKNDKKPKSGKPSGKPKRR
ncbi:Uu.00g078140.m01.CDS01 [Anthostomella pinea]|uniref:RNA helicase n=1 Tax=Anthostomella pinea TaxID=933095 RepID=A0AAI8VKM5_9PEZI|nr:Uu.00g078140.m01.CDS01 [Anthostomella pinea]